MTNFLQRYLDNDCRDESINPLDAIKKELGVSTTVFDNLVIFSYNQIDSPKTNPVVRMCRGIVLEKDTWQIVAYPFYRFYNFEEVPEEREKFNWDKAVATEKVDGSLVSVFNYHGKWYISTRSKIGGDNKINDNIHTFKDIFNLAIAPLTFDEFTDLLDEQFCYTFELVSPFNRIVTEYKENKIYFIGCRDKITFNEIPYYEMYKQFDQKLKDIVLIPKIIPLVNENGEFRGFEEMKALANGLNQMDEGFVVTDFSHLVNGNFPRTKVKNSAYVALHHLRGTLENGNITYHNILNIVYKNEVDEVCASLPHYANIIHDVQDKWNKFIEAFNTEVKTIKHYLVDDIDITDKDLKKEFALTIKSYKFSRFYFAMLNLRTDNLRILIDNMLKTKQADTIFKNLWENYVSKY